MTSRHTLYEQAPMTAHDYMNSGSMAVVNCFGGKWFAKNSAAAARLVAAYVKACNIDFNANLRHHTETGDQAMYNAMRRTDIYLKESLRFIEGMMNRERWFREAEAVSLYAAAFIVEAAVDFDTGMRYAYEPTRLSDS